MDDTSYTRRLKNLLRPLLRTPLHPQWLAAIVPTELRSWIAAIEPASVVLDIGCADQWLQRCLPGTCAYYGIDYPETSAGYGTRPAIYADAHSVPFRDGSVDVVVMLDVLEHLRDPERALTEVSRVLAPGGKLILQVPFLYPVHDAPNDHTRWTIFGHRSLASRAGLQVSIERYAGEPVVTSALLTNIALTHSVLASLRRKHWGALVTPILPFIVLMINILAWLLSHLFERSMLMPYSYQAIWIKKAGPTAPRG